MPLFLSKLTETRLIQVSDRVVTVLVPALQAHLEAPYSTEVPAGEEEEEVPTFPLTLSSEMLSQINKLNCSKSSAYRIY